MEKTIEKQVNWATMIPLIGGSAIGCSLATGNKPLYHLSYSAFGANEKHLTNYWPEIPRIVLDEGGQIPGSPVDFVNSVCPCAGLSQLNTSRSKEVRDSKNKWMFESAEIVLGKVKPKVFFGENAPGLFTNSGEYVRDKLKNLAQKHNYSFSLYKTNTILHGIPQRRMRTFYFFWNSPNPPVLNFYKRKSPSFVDYISQIPETASWQDTFNIEGKATDAFRTYEFLLEYYNIPHRDFVKRYDGTAIHSVYSYLAENNLLSKCIMWLYEKYPESRELPRLYSIRKKVESGGRFMDSSPGFYHQRTNAIVGRTLTHLMHPLENRGMSIRELMHMMGLPHDFEIDAKKSLNHLAQNVPTCTSRDMTLEILKFLKNELEYSNTDFLMQDNCKEVNKECEL